ncbi:hypothetical protein SDC9_163018 [bioreactor metagenome]|uniref:Uncharacterized protein n=1 Tax=bioreactor metagenome TaxID=1076179 RepID=A0A645FUL5_9ZZZZ
MIFSDPSEDQFDPVHPRSGDHHENRRGEQRIPDRNVKLRISLDQAEGDADGGKTNACNDPVQALKETRRHPRASKDADDRGGTGGEKHGGHSRRDAGNSSFHDSDLISDDQGHK